LLIFVNFKVNGVLKYAETAKIREFDTFRNVNHEGVDTVLVTVAHSKYPVEHVYTGVIYVKLKDTRQSL